MNSISSSVQKNWWESQGFFIGLVALIGSLWGLSEAQATSAVTAVTGAITAVAFLFQFFKTSKFKGWADVLRNSNTWAYLAGIIGSFLPNAVELVPALKGLSDAIFSKNLGAILTALFSLGVMIYNIFIKKK